MRKAFDANVPKLRPRLKAGALPEAREAGRSRRRGGRGGERGNPGAGGGRGELAPPRSPAEADWRVRRPTRPRPRPATAGHPERSVSAEAETRSRAPTPTRGAARAEPVEEARAEEVQPPNDVVSRRERLEKIKRRVADAARPAPRFEPVPGDPARAAESVLGLVRDLEVELMRAREREDALRADLDQARTELARTSGEARTSAERLVSAEAELVEKRAVLTELLGEMTALEEERDEALRRAQAMAALDEERARLLEEVTRKADEEARLRAEGEEEVERLSEELRAGSTESARLRTAIGELARERDQLAGELDRIRSRARRARRREARARAGPRGPRAGAGAARLKSAAVGAPAPRSRARQRTVPRTGDAPNSLTVV